MRYLSFFICAASLAAAPTITGVYNAASWLPPSLPNSGVAQGAYFTVTGSGLGPAGLLVAPSYPLQTTQGLGGTVVNVTVGSVSLPCIMYYTSATQVSAIVPSATPVGNATISVSYQGSSATIAIKVVAGDFGIFTLNSAGSGPASITDLSYTPITMVHAAHSGDTVIIWGTGLGAVSGDETEPPSPSNFSGVQVLIGNQLVTPAYAGRSSFPGLDQINFTIPAISGGCQTSIGVVVNGVTGNVVTTSIAPAGQVMCGDTLGALTTKNLEKAVANAALNIGVVDLSRVGGGSDGFVAVFATYPLNSLIRSYAGTFAPSPGSCVVYEVAAADPLILSDPVVSSLPHLDAGPSVSLSSLNGATITVNPTFTGVYEKVVGTSSSPYISPGEFGVSNGSGGAQVGPFDWEDSLPALLDFVGLPSTLNRASDLTVRWTNGLSYAMVNILGYSAVPLTSAQDSWVNFVCSAPSTATQFAIPAAILSMLPTNGYGASGTMGVLLQVAGLVDNRFTIAGTPGIDAGMFTMFASTGSVLKVQ